MPRYSFRPGPFGYCTFRRRALTKRQLESIRFFGNRRFYTAFVVRPARPVLRRTGTGGAGGDTTGPTAHIRLDTLDWLN